MLSSTDDFSPTYTKLPCPVVRNGDDVTQLVAKRLPPGHPLANIPGFAEKENLICSFPGLVKEHNLYTDRL